MKVITATSDLAAFCKSASSHPFATVDTEFLRETTYWPKLCLVQIATPEDAAIVDPLAPGISLDPLFELLANPDVVKVFHAARQDIEIFVKLSGKVPTNLFDTQIAASVCGYGDSASYDSLVQAVCGLQIDKSSRFTDWSHRPLSEKQLNYALADVTHLRDIYLTLLDKIDQMGRHAWVDDENAVLASIDTYIVKPENAWKRLKLKVNRPRDLAALKRLAAWREQRAQETDQPRGRILKDEALYELAVQRPLTPEAFEKLRTLSRGFGRSAIGSELIGLFRQIEDLPKAELPTLPKRTRGPSPKGPIGDLLRVLLKAVSEKNGVAPRIIATSDDIDSIVLDDEADVPALKGWRRGLFGNKALAIKHGQMALAATPNGVVEVDVDVEINKSVSDSL